MTNRRIVILGAGPCGLGAASTLSQLGYRNWHLYEANEKEGGLATTLTTPEGFSFDLGSHAVFSHYPHFDAMCRRVCKDWHEYTRSTHIYMRQRFIPYPLQRNFGKLPHAEVNECLRGMLNRPRFQNVPSCFDDWLRQQFGDGLYRIFLEPYNYKVWAYHPSQLTSQWVGERVAQVNTKELHAIAKGKEDTTWGPNATVRYPLYGGMGAIWKGLVNEIDSSHFSFNKQVTAIDAKTKTIYFNDQTTDAYDSLITTIPLKCLCMIVKNIDKAIHTAASQFIHSSVHIIGLGLAGVCPKFLRTKNWLYFPESTIPFHRATIPSNYSSHVVMNPGKEWSLTFEISESPTKPVARDIAQTTIATARDIGLIPPGTSIISTFHQRLEYGYPTPFIGRDDVLNSVQPLLQKQDIYSRGRFGGWKYEVSNHDHSYAQGVEVAHFLLHGIPELTYLHPERINS